MIGSFVGIGHPASVEVLAWAGFELVCIDAEHSAFGAADVESLVRAAAAAGARALVRVSGVGPEISHALDAGADGVVVPRVESAEDARACVSAVRYPPVGARGAGPGRAAQYGRDFAGYLARANDDVALVLQIETVRGLENVDEIAAVDGVDLIFVGPGDLAVSLGVQGGSDEHSAAVRRIVAAAREAGVDFGIFCLDPADVPTWTGEGARLVLLGGDLGFLAVAAAAAAQTATSPSGVVVS